ncbi:MAG: type IV pilus twitching motility protein PilT [Eubacteriales bacterium]|nr:type IV pilus twitching motility protein PilT [Eubacteriales bacterium]
MHIEQLILLAKKMGASDIHLVAGLEPKCRVDGKLTSMNPERLTHEQCEEYARELAGSRYQDIKEIGELDLAQTIADERVRINLFRQQGHVSAALRILSNRIPKLEDLGLPPIVNQFPSWQKGIILVTGETGSGKSTTLAAILDRINHSRTDHIITLEDPVEYIYEPDQCVINQREVGKDTESYDLGLRAILREDPDVILIGEMRDLSTIETALTAAETGHLVFATLHTNSAPDAIDRIVGVFPAERQPQIRIQLSTTLRAVLAQQLLPKRNNLGRIAACEVMVVTPAIRNLIREGKTPQMLSAMLSSASEGSVTMDNFLIKLLREKKISPEVAVEAAYDKIYVNKHTI